MSLGFFSTVCDFECDFDTPGNLCRWTVHNDNPLVYGFFQYSGPTGTEGTGPDDDFSKPGCKETLCLVFNHRVTKTYAK